MRRALIGAATMMLLGVAAVPATAATAFADPQFQAQWQQGEAITPNFWGPLALAREGQRESYVEQSGGQRLVQYFDKGRMELTGGVVTNGLLATDLVRGQIQVGNVAFEQKPSPAIPIAGDPDNPGPTYAQLASKGKGLLDAAPQQTGNYAQGVVSSSGDISVSSAGPTAYATFTVYDDITKHNVPKAFADYRAKAGIPAIGLAISEPFTATVKVGGQQRQVMVQVYERRVLTYTDANPDAFKMEMGNIGQHYYIWRYGGSTPAAAAPSPAAPGPVTASPSPPAQQLVPPTGGDQPQSPAMSGVRFASVMGNVRGGKAIASVVGPPDTACTLTFTPPQGTAGGGGGLGTSTTSAMGFAAWTWTIPDKTVPGTGTLSVRCGAATASAPIAIGQ